jgi:hypothetical protein
MSIILDGTTGITTPDLTDSSLTSGRVVYAGASGNLTGASGLTFDGNTLILTGVQQITNSSGSTLILDRTSNPGSLQLNYNGTQTGQVQAASGGGLIFYQGSTPTEGMRLTSTGLGIGLTNPSAKLHVRGDSSSTTAMVGAYVHNLNIDANTQAGLGFFNYDNFSAKIYSPRSGSTTGSIVFATNNGGGIAESNVIDRARITSDGNLVVGGTSTTFRFTAIGASVSSIVGVASLQNPVNAAGTGHGASLVLHSTADSNRGVAIASSSTANYAVDNAMVFYTSASSSLTERARIDSAGNLLVGTTSLNGAAANNRAIVGGGFHSLSGELTTLASGTAYTMFTAPADFCTYLVNVHGGASAAIYSETAIVQINNTSVRVDIISDGPTVVIDNSGYAIRATQNSGNTMGYLIWSAVRMA